MHVGEALYHLYGLVTALERSVNLNAVALELIGYVRRDLKVISDFADIPEPKEHHLAQMMPSMTEELARALSGTTGS
jgi:hypothetical protein